MNPETIGNYRLLGPLADSRAGLIYRAVHQETNQPVAVKVVPAERFRTPAIRRRFLQEARAAVRLSHPHLRQLYEVGESGEELYLAMEYLEGCTLKSLLVSGALEAETALAWAVEIAEALAAAHAWGIVHGALIPAKVFITEEGTAKLLDTGLWRLAVPMGVDLSQEANLIDARLPAWVVAALSPEQIRGQKPTARSDIFALGRLVYEMTTGRNPFAGQSAVQSMHRALRRTPGPASQFVRQVPAALDTVLARALEKQPRARWSQAGEVATALRAVAAGEELPRERRRGVMARLTWPLWAGIGVLVILLVLWFVYLALTRP